MIAMQGHNQIQRVYKAEYEGNILRFTLLRDNTASRNTPPIFYLPKLVQAITAKGLEPNRNTRHGDEGLYYDTGDFKF